MRVDAAQRSTGIASCFCAEAAATMSTAPFDRTRMNSTFRPHVDAAFRGRRCAGAGRIDSGITSGRAGSETKVDANRLAINLASARGLLKQFGAAH